VPEVTPEKSPHYPAIVGGIPRKAQPASPPFAFNQLDAANGDGRPVAATAAGPCSVVIAISAARIRQPQAAVHRRCRKLNISAAAEPRTAPACAEMG